MAGPLKPLFFTTRADGTMIPLLAVDELPEDIRFEGVKTQLTPHDIAGMIGIGTHECRGRYHELVKPINTTSSTPTDRSLAASKFAADETVLPRPNLSPAARPRAYGIDEQPPRDVTITREGTPEKEMQQMTTGSNKPVALPSWHQNADVALNTAPGVKEYCSYWLRNGECDYAQQGCIYRHEMPLDHLTLSRLGLLDIPRWYREKYCLASLRARENQVRSPSSQPPDRMRRSKHGNHTPCRYTHGPKIKGKFFANENTIGRLNAPMQGRLLLGSPSSSLHKDQPLITRPRVVVVPSTLIMPQSLPVVETHGAKVDEAKEVTKSVVTHTSQQTDPPAESQVQKLHDRFCFGDRIRFKTVVPVKHVTPPPKGKDSSEDEGDNELSSGASTRSPVTSASDIESNATMQSVTESLSLPEAACTDPCCAESNMTAESVMEKVTVKLPTPTENATTQGQLTQFSVSTVAPSVTTATSQISDLAIVTARPQPASVAEVSAAPIPTGPMYGGRGGKRRFETRGRKQPKRTAKAFSLGLGHQSPNRNSQQGQMGMMIKSPDLLLDLSE